MIYTVNSRFLKRISHKTIFWHIPTNKKELFLTFDDGPVPGITEFILDELDRHHAKATFFCVGDNIRKYPGLFKEILNRGHNVGNHTYHHLNGWKHSLRSYLNNVKMCESLTGTKLFRPPYGRMTPLQRYILQRDYYIILYSVLPGDFDPGLSMEKCLERVIRHSDNPGSIIVFHDSYKAEYNLKYALPRYLEYYTQNGYTFSAITPELCQLNLEQRRSKIMHQISLGII
jgi:peptidoglycan/xylan/chitin deacetylase (PgdA/CDA1 family)